MQSDLFNSSLNRVTSQNISEADQFNVSATFPDDFGMHYQDEDPQEVVEWLEGRGDPENWDVSVWKGNRLLGQLNGLRFVEVIGRLSS